MAQRLSKELLDTAEYETVPELRIGASSIAAEAHPDRNEDQAYQNLQRREIGAFDGVGGSGGYGAEASMKAVQAVEEVLSDAKYAGELTPDLAAQAVQEALVAADKRVNAYRRDVEAQLTAKGELSQNEIDKVVKNIATTASIIKLVPNPDGSFEGVVGHAGDSRIYVMRKDGGLEQVTSDDSAGLRFAESDKGEAYRKELEAQFDDASDVADLPPDAARYFKMRNVITKAVGQGNVQFALSRVSLNQGDQVFAFSDGIHDNLKRNEVQAIIAAGGTPEEIVGRLTQAALARSREGTSRSKGDDLTAVGLEIGTAAAKEADGERNNPANYETQIVPLKEQFPGGPTEAYNMLSLERQDDLRACYLYPEVRQYVAGLKDDELTFLYAALAGQRMTPADGQRASELVREYTASQEAAALRLLNEGVRTGELKGKDNSVTWKLRHLWQLKESKSKDDTQVAELRQIIQAEPNNDAKVQGQFIADFESGPQDTRVFSGAEVTAVNKAAQPNFAQRAGSAFRGFFRRRPNTTAVAQAQAAKDTGRQKTYAELTEDDFAPGRDER